jgi:hypothetical protein
MTTLEKLKNSFVPSLFAGAVSVGIHWGFYGSEFQQINLGPLMVPTFVAVGVTSVIGNMGGEILTQWVLPMIPKNETIHNLEENIIPPVLSGGATWLALKVLVNDDAQLLPAFIIGAAGSVGGKYIYGTGLPGSY